MDTVAPAAAVELLEVEVEKQMAAVKGKVELEPWKSLEKCLRQWKSVQILDPFQSYEKHWLQTAIYIYIQL